MHTDAKWEGKSFHCHITTMSKARFDPAAHLHKHGWKGKGTGEPFRSVTRVSSSRQAGVMIRSSQLTRSSEAGSCHTTHRSQPEEDIKRSGQGPR